MRIAIVDDNEKDRRALYELLKRYFGEQGTDSEIVSFVDGEDFLLDWPDSYDYIFLDVRMEHLDGIRTAEAIRRDDDLIPIIFLTDSTMHSLESYAVHVADYLLKPPTKEMIGKLMDRLTRMQEKSLPKALSFRTKEGISRVYAADILYVEYKDRKSILHTEREPVSVKMTMRELEQELPDTFFRVHSAFVINLAKVKRLKGNEVYVGGEAIPVSKHRRKELLRVLGEFWGIETGWRD